MSMWFILSGVGGAGKTISAFALASISAQHRKTLFLDCCGASRKGDYLLGIENNISLSLEDVLSGSVPLNDALYPCNNKNLDYACISLFHSVPLQDYLGLFFTLQAMYDLLVLDVPSGELNVDLRLIRPSDRFIITSYPDPASMRANCMITDILSQYRNQVMMILNFADKPLMHRKIQLDAYEIENSYGLHTEGIVYYDPMIHAATIQKKDFTMYPKNYKQVFEKIYNSIED